MNYIPNPQAMLDRHNDRLKRNIRQRQLEILASKHQARQNQPTRFERIMSVVEGSGHGSIERAAERWVA